MKGLLRFFLQIFIQTRLIYSELSKIVEEQFKIATDSDSPDRWKKRIFGLILFRTNFSFRLRRMEEECDFSSETMLEFYNHIVRSTANEAVRKRIVEELEKGDALITMDFSLKLLPKTNMLVAQDYRWFCFRFSESQSAWFAKKGITFHCSHVLTVMEEEYYQHTLGCVVQECKQV